MKNLIGLDKAKAYELSDMLNQLLADYVKYSKIKEEKSIVNGVEGVKVIVENFSIIITLERKVLGFAAEADDEGTVSLMSDYISQTEKTLWMLSSYLK